MPTSSWIWGSKVWAVLEKEILSELRTRYALSTLLMFSIVTITAVSFSAGQFALSPDTKAALFWLILFFASLAGLAQVFIKEEESRTGFLLKLAAPAPIIYIGKLLYNCFLLVLLEVVIIPLYLVLMNLDVGNMILFLAVALLGSLALASATTILGAIISKTSIKGALFGVLAFPLLIPVLVAGIEGTRLAERGAPFGEASGQLGLLFSYSVVLVTISLLLFELVWSE